MGDKLKSAIPGNSKRFRELVSCLENSFSKLIILHSAVEGQEAQQTPGLTEDAGFQPLGRWLKTTLSPSLRRRLSRTLDRVHIVD